MVGRVEQGRTVCHDGSIRNEWYIKEKRTKGRQDESREEMEVNSSLKEKKKDLNVDVSLIRRETPLWMMNNKNNGSVVSALLNGPNDKTTNK